MFLEAFCADRGPMAKASSSRVKPNVSWANRSVRVRCGLLASLGGEVVELDVLEGIYLVQSV